MKQMKQAQGDHACVCAHISQWQSRPQDLSLPCPSLGLQHSAHPVFSFTEISVVSLLIVLKHSTNSTRPELEVGQVPLGYSIPCSQAKVNLTYEVCHGVPASSGHLGATGVICQSLDGPCY